jgi:hypothetical protein
LRSESQYHQWPAKHRDKAAIRQLLDTEPNLGQYRLTEQLVQKHGEGILAWCHRTV